MKLHIKTVAERTGVAAMTLRAWERRYGFPTPTRTDGGYRLYSPEDVDAVRRVSELTSQGLPLHEAIAAVRDGNIAPPKEDDIEAFWDAAIALDEARMERVLANARASMTALDFCDHFALPILRDICSRLDISREHFASAMLRQALRSVAEATPIASNGRRILLACPEHEHHEGGLLALGIHLRVRGWRVLVLGANTPADAIAEAARTFEPEAIGVTFVYPTAAEQLQQRLQALLDRVSVPVVAGGSAARQLRESVEATSAMYADSVDELVALLDKKRKRGK